MAGGYKNMNLFEFIFISLAFSESFLGTKGMGLCDFADKFPCDDNGGSRCLKSPGCKKLNQTNTREGSHLTTVQFSGNRSTSDNVSTNEQLIDHLTSDYVTTNQATTDQLMSTTLTCPPNMVYANCSTCQATCMDPKGCISNCTEPVMCVCPNGFLLKGDGCVLDEECGCFVEDVGVIPEGAIYISSNCSRRCSCSSGQLDCNDTYRCSPNAVCEVRKDVQQCFCSVGYEGDGVTCASSPSDCLDVYNTISTKSDVYKIKPTTWQGDPFDVYCEMTNGGGWTVFQRRIDGVTNFYRDWTAYKNGFGSTNQGDDYWLGNEQLHHLTKQKPYRLRVDITKSDGSNLYAEYASFSISSEDLKYKLNISPLTAGNAGDGLYSYDNGGYFTTHDNDNDQCSYRNCAEGVGGAGWYTNRWCKQCSAASPYCSYYGTTSCRNWCSFFNLNGIYSGSNGQNIYWYYHCNLKYANMKIRPP